MAGASAGSLAAGCAWLRKRSSPSGAPSGGGAPNSSMREAQETATTRLATGKSSELHKIFERVGQQAGNSQIALLISDCVLSFPDDDIRANPNINRENAPSTLKNQINDQFARFRKDSIGATVYAFSSAFNGTYYDYRNQKQTLAGEQRPFYVWAIGKERVLSLFNQQLSERLSAQPEHRLDFGSGQTLTDYSLFFTLNKKGEWDAGSGEIKGLKKTKPTNPAEFALGIDLRGLPAYAQTTDYLTKNMKLSAGNANVTLLSVKKRDEVTNTEKLKEREKKMLADVSHVLTLRVEQLYDAETPVTITLPARYDRWYEQQSTMDDTKAADRQGKTFALEHLLAGVREAYETGAGPFLKLNVTLHQ